MICGVGEDILDLREDDLVPGKVESGALISGSATLLPFETSLVCRRGDGFVTDELRDTISSFKGDGARGGLLFGGCGRDPNGGLDGWSIGEKLVGGL